MVLWTIAVLALLGAGLTASSRTGLRIAAAMRDAAQVEAAADGAVHEAILRLADGGGLHWPADRIPRETQIGGIPVVVTVENLAGRLNPNTAPDALIAAVLTRFGLDAEPAAALGSALFDWHMPGPLASAGGTRRRAYMAAGLGYFPPGQPFERDDEARAVLGMTPAIAAVLRPFLSIHNDGPIDPAFAAQPLRLALEATGINQFAAPEPSATVEIVADARLPSGAAFERRAVIRFRAGVRFQILDWSQGGD